MKVLLVSSSFFPKIDGSTRCVYDHARKLVQRGNAVSLVTRGIPGAKRLEVLDGIRITRSSYSYQGGVLANRIRLMLEQMLIIIMLQRKERFRIIHAHGFTAGLASLPSKYLFGIPVVITTHGTELLWPKGLWWKSQREIKLTLIFEKFVLNHCNVIIAQSPGVKDYMVKIYGPGITKKMQVIPTGVDHEKFKPSAKSTGIPQILFVGALSEIKGVNCLLRAFAIVHEKVPDAKLVLVGSGPRAPEYKKLVGEMGLDGAVRFQGPVRDDARLVSLYDESDIVVLPSNVGGPVSCTVMEGLSCGRAVITTDLPGGLHDILIGGAGILMHPEDSEGLALELEKLLLQPSYLLALQTRARKEVESKYTLNSMADSLTSLYTKLGG